MLYPKPLQNYFYFINNSTVFDIATSNDKDECGQQLMKDTDAENAEVFPVIVVETNPKKDDGTYDTETTNTYYFWYQYLIKDGDKYENSTFVMYTHDSDNPDGDYIDVVKNSANEDIEALAAKGYTLEAIKANLPWWVYAQVGNIVTINGKQEKVKKNDFSSDFGDSAITTLIYDKLNAMVASYANEKLKKHGLILKDCEPKLIDFTSDVNPLEEGCTHR